MSATTVVFLFPGYGAYFPGALRAAAQRYAVVDTTLKEIDAVCQARLGSKVRDLLLDPAAPSLETLLRSDPNTLQMAVYAASICAYRILEARGCEPSILVGHSLGEIAALVCGGAFTVTQGAEIIAARTQTLKPAAGSGYMAVIGASPRRCGAIIELLETPQANVAVDNGPSQTVMSGATAAMDRIAGVAQALGLAFARLPSPYPFHSSQLVPIAKAFRTAISRQARKALRVPIYSPILERVYEDKDDLAIALSSHLVRPVRFAATVRHLRQTSDSLVFVEIGASNALSKLVQRILSDPNLPAFATFAASSEETSTLDATLAELRARRLVQPEVDLRLLQSLLPQQCSEAELTQFWDARGTRILKQVAEEFAGFRRTADVAVVVPAAKEIPAKAAQPVAKVETATVVKPEQPARVPSQSRAALQKEIVALYAREMAYPPEVFTESVALEARLGINAARQAKLMSALEEKYRLPPRPQNLRSAELDTIGKITDYVLQAMERKPEVRPVAEVISLVEEVAVSVPAAREPVPAAPEQAPTPPKNEEPIVERPVLVPVPAGEPDPVLSQTFVPVADEVTCRSLPAPLSPAAVLVPVTREALAKEIVASYAEAAQRSPAAIGEDVEVEAGLGIDSAKHAEVLKKLAARYRLPADGETLRASEFGTLRKIIDFMHQAIVAEGMHIEEHIVAVPLPTVAPAFIPSESEIERERAARSALLRPGVNLTREALQTEIVALFAEAMEYPPEVFAEDVDLEGELGIDSVKQMELLSKLETRYELPSRPETFRLSDYDTLRKVTDFVYDAIALCLAERVQRTPVYAVG
jgi:acyl transferase domain-containing protein